ncbi:MAG TPA: PAS domain S-box protein [Roseiflexaceae bacterium]|nr:PAS domain S-box protein [Roseiflexaceae bacterium]
MTTPEQDEIARLRRRVAELEQRLAAAPAPAGPSDEVAMFRAIEAHAPGILYQFVLRPDGSMVMPYVSAGVRTVLGVEPENISAQPQLLTDGIEPEDRERFYRTVAESAAQLSTWSWEGRFNLGPNRQIWCRAVSQPLRQEDGSVVWYGMLIDISEQKRLETELRMFQSVVNNAPDAILLADNDGRIFYANRAAHTLLGYDDGLVGQPLNVLILPELEGTQVQAISDAVATEGVWHGVAPQRRRDGSTFPGSAAAFAIRGDGADQIALAVTFRDISVQLRAERALRENEARLRLVIGNAPIVLSALDAQGTITLSEGKGLEALGLTPGQVVGMSIFDLFAPYPDITGAVRQALQGEAAQVSTRYESLAFEHSLTPLYDERQQIAGAIMVSIDIGDRLRAEEEQLALREEVIAAQQAALREISTPLIPLAAGVVVMPLVGAIDARRAQQMTETLLDGIVTHQADVAILDITGVPVVDTQVADALLRTARAVKLLGAQVVLTGIGGGVAQSLIHLGANLTDIITLNNLQSGITYALQKH